MASFWELPRPLREKIYRLHLVHEKPVDHDEHRRRTNQPGCGRNDKNLPAICLVSTKAEKEAAPIYYGENHFEISRLSCFAYWTFPRHLRLIRRLTFVWYESYSTTTGAGDNFQVISRMKGLNELYVRVHERQMIQSMMPTRHNRQSYYCRSPSAQQQLAVLRHPGMNALLSLSGLRHVKFLKALDSRGQEYVDSGPIPGGILETYVKPKITAPTSTLKFRCADDDSLPFLSLPPEIRNLIYELLLEVDGPVHPSPKPPSSIPRCNKARKDPVAIPESALNILAVNRQVKDEALGIFYHSNAFEFYYPTQLHAFLLTLGPQRQNFLRDITLHYYNTKSGGIDLASLSFPLLAQLHGLRRFHLLFTDDLVKRISGRWWWGRPYRLEKANPNLLPGIKSLFALRGITDINVREMSLETHMETMKADKAYPDFPEHSRDACFLKLASILEYFNAALRDAQYGKVNRKILDDDEWHMKDPFPAMDDE